MRPKSDIEETKRMYADYRKGLSCEAVGRKYHYSGRTIWQRFKNAGLTLRPSNKAIHEYIGEVAS